MEEPVKFPSGSWDYSLSPTLHLPPTTKTEGGMSREINSIQNKTLVLTCH